MYGGISFGIWHGVPLELPSCAHADVSISLEHGSVKLLVTHHKMCPHARFRCEANLSDLAYHLRAAEAEHSQGNRHESASSSPSAPRGRSQ